MAQKNSQKHLIGSPGPSGSLDGRVKKRGTGYRLPSQAKYIVESVRKFFEHERLHSKAVMRNRVVDRTAKACGICKTTVKKIHQEFADFSGTLESPEKRLVEDTVEDCLAQFGEEDSDDDDSDVYSDSDDEM